MRVRARALNEFVSPFLPLPPAPSSHFFRPLLPLFLHSFLPSLAVILLAPLAPPRTYARVLFSLVFFFSWCARGTRGASENVHHVRDGQGDYSTLRDLISSSSFPS